MVFQHRKQLRLHKDFMREMSWLDIPLTKAGFENTSMVKKSKIIADIFCEIKHNIEFKQYKFRNKKRGVNVKILL